MIPWASVLDEIRKHAESDPKREVCGIILTDGNVLRCPNIAKDSATRYEIFPARLEQFENKEIVGFYHSHVDRAATPTFLDMAKLPMSGKRYIIVAVRDGKVTERTEWMIVLDPITGRRNLTRRGLLS